MKKMPKEFDAALKKRRKYAEKLLDEISKVDFYIREAGLEWEVEDFDYATGCEVFCNPKDSEARIREAWERKYNNG